MEQHSPFLLMSKTRRKRGGFSLIETAIVLAIVGLVIGGIWVAASTVSQNMTVKRLAEGSLSFFQAAAAYADGQKNVGPGIFANPPFIISAGLVPKDFVVDETAGTLSYGGVDIGTVASTFGTTEYHGTGLVYSFPFNSSGAAMCRKLIVQLTNLAWRKVVWVYGYNGSGPIYPFGGGIGTPTILTGPITPAHTGLSICNNDFFGTGKTVVAVVYGLYR